MNNRLNRQKKTISGVIGENMPKNLWVKRRIQHDFLITFKYIEENLIRIKIVFVIED